MRKYGVACNCHEGEVPKELVKTASGEEKCPECGKIHKNAVKK